MEDDEKAPSGSYEDRLVDEKALETYLTEVFGSVESWSLRRHSAGHSNETLFLDWGSTPLVLRRPPPGETAETAHDVLREYRVMEALQAEAVPVPQTVKACEDESIIGAEFYLMERLDGVVVRDEEPEQFNTPPSRAAIANELVETLAAIHLVDVSSVDLRDFGQAPGFTERQVRRWSEQLTWAFETTATVREVPDLYEVMSWLSDSIPPKHPESLVHGDFKLDNVVFSSSNPPGIEGVLDWEMATLGDPRTDLGWLLTFWRDSDDAGLPAPGLQPAFTTKPGYPPRHELVDRWESLTGFQFEHERFYRVLALYKLAALGEMFFARYLRGDADDPLYPRMESQVPALAAHALAITESPADES